MAKKDKKDAEVTKESEMHDLAIQRVKDLKGLGRKDRAKIGDISRQFHVDSADIKKKWADKKAKDDAAAAADAIKKKEAAEKAADKKANDKQKDK